MKKFVVVTKEEDFGLALDDVEVISARDYLTNPRFSVIRNARVYNLCNQYRYQAAGYYVSLLAQARGHRPIPSITTILDTKSQTVIKTLSDEIDRLIQQSLHHLTTNDFELSIYFGKNIAKHYEELSRALYNIFESPLIRAFFTFNKKWQLARISTISYREIPEHHLPYIKGFAQEYFSGRKMYTSRKMHKRYSVAILTDPQEKAPPSDKRALERFARAADKIGLEPRGIFRDELSEISKHDALFIRATTSVTNFTYRFARKAAAEGLVVVDDPISILRCTNKVYLHELMTHIRVPIPKSLIVHKYNAAQIVPTLGFPVVLKQPDSSFSMGVSKAENPQQLDTILHQFFDTSDFVVAQEYIPTDFDWRIGILDNKPLFACKYFMARNHWQIYNWKAAKKSQSGKWATIAVEDVDPDIVKYALRATAPIGNGFYGVDLKVFGKRIVVIEVNDNPSLESSVEDAVMKDKLYDALAHFFLVNIEKKQKEGAL